MKEIPIEELEARLRELPPEKLAEVMEFISKLAEAQVTAELAKKLGEGANLREGKKTD